MNIRTSYLFFFVATSLLLLYSCSSTKYVPKNEYLLNKSSVKVDAKNISYFDMEPYIKQKANYKTFELFKFPLFMYDLSGKDSTKWYNRALKKGGEPPVIYDSTLVDGTVMQLSRVMYNKGYLHVNVKPEISKRNRKVDVVYDIKSGIPTIINNYSLHINDSLFDVKAIRNSIRIPKKNRKEVGDISKLNIDQLLQIGSILHKGEQFDLEMLDKERERITNILRQNGYMKFEKEYIGYIADTLADNNQVDLELIVYPYTQNINNTETKYTSHTRYIIDKVDIYVDYDPISDGNFNDYVAKDSVLYNNFKILYGKRGRYIKPSAILNNCYIEPGRMFNDRRTTMTYNALSQLHILRNINIRYEEYTENNKTKLRCIITAVPDKKQGISTEIEGTNSAGFFGVGAAIGYLHRNVFKGSELFNAKLRGSYEAVTPRFSDFNNNYFEIGGETSISFPRFIFPFISKKLKRRLRASTQLFSSYTYQRRPSYFTRTIFSTGVKYIWENRGNNTSKHTLDLLDISYAHIPKLSPSFENTLSENAKIYSFTDQFIVSIGYTYSKTNNTATELIPVQRRNRQTYSFRSSIETAGNLLSLVGSLADLPKGENGSRKIFGTYFAQYVKGNVDYSQTIHIDNKNAIAWRLGGGIAFPYGNNKLVPFQKRFLSGGANSVRGWNARELGPGAFYREDANFNDQSGDIRFDANIEYRSKAFWKLEFAAFLDAGNIWTIKGTERQYKGEFKFNKFYKQIASAWGLGLRLDFDFVLIRLDCGWKFYNPADIPNFKSDPSGYLVPDGYMSKWSVLKPLDFKNNVTWHIAVGYPF